MIQGLYVGTLRDRAPLAMVTIRWSSGGMQHTMRCAAILDTGASQSVIYDRVWYRWLARQHQTALPPGADRYWAQCDVEVEGVAHTRPLPVPRVSISHPGAEDMLLGQDFLQDYVATFDGPAESWTLRR
jgi:hypothetical protein